MRRKKDEQIKQTSIFLPLFSVLQHVMHENKNIHHTNFGVAHNGNCYFHTNSQFNTLASVFYSFYCKLKNSLEFIYIVDQPHWVHIYIFIAHSKNQKKKLLAGKIIRLLFVERLQSIKWLGAIERKKPNHTSSKVFTFVDKIWVDRFFHVENWGFRGETKECSPYHIEFFLPSLLVFCSSDGKSVLFYRSIWNAKEGIVELVLIWCFWIHPKADGNRTKIYE